VGIHLAIPFDSDRVNYVALEKRDSSIGSRYAATRLGMDRSTFCLR
jgi:hypothetical protein